MLQIDPNANKERPTTPVVNILQYDQEVMLKFTEIAASPEGYFINIHRVNEHPVRAHKEIFGKQSYCLTTYRRYWVWDFGRFRVYVHPEAGTNFEVNVGTRTEDAISMVKQYAKVWAVAAESRKV